MRRHIIYHTVIFFFQLDQPRVKKAAPAKKPKIPKELLLHKDGTWKMGLKIQKGGILSCH